MPGTLYGVSVGPGDPELITLKAMRIIEKCPVIAVPRTRGENMLALSIAERAADMSGKRIVPLDFPMSRDRDVLERNYDRAAVMLREELDTSDAAMLCLGDLSVYSTFSYIAEREALRDVNTELCAGVTSFCAASSALGISLVKGNDMLSIIPYACEDFEQKLLSDGGTKVIMKCGKHSDELIALLDRLDMLSMTCAVENCGLPDERTVREITPGSSFGYFTVFIVGG